MIWRLDTLLLRMLEHYGPVWPIVAVLCLAYVTLGKLHRAFLVGMVVLLGAMVWYRPLIALAHVLRWWIFAVLAVRGTLFVLVSLRGSPSGRGPPWPVAALGLLSLISCLWAESTLFSFVMAGTFVCTLVLSFLVAWRLMETVDFLRHLCLGAVLLALLLHGVGCALGLAAIVTRDPYLVRQTGIDGRFAGVMLNANGSGVFGAILWPIVLAAPRVYLGRLQWLRWLALLALAVCIVFSGSRTAAGVTLMTTFLYALYRFRAGAILTTGLVGGIGAVLLTMTPLEELEGSVVDEVVVRSSTLSDLGGRLEHWEMGWSAAMEKPVFGHGWGAARTLDDTDVERSLELGRVKAATNLHSTHISLLVDLGFVGLGLFWLFGGTVVLAGLRLLAAPRTPETSVSVLFFASTLGMLADTVVHNGVLAAGSPGAIIFWFSAALVVKQSYGLAAPEATGQDPIDGVAAGPAALAAPMAGA